jgi:tetratricopeptide (TPR) repeat protein
VALTRALDSYAALLRLQDTWAPDLLNAGMLYELADDPAAAERLWAAALPRWQEWPLPSLVLADWYAQQGRGEEAYNLFESALLRNVRSGDTVACRRNPVCRRLKQSFPMPERTTRDVHRDARRLLDDGQAAQALSALQVVPVTSRSSLIWIDRAEAHIALGQSRAARYALETALTLEGNNGVDTASRLALLRAGLLTLEGKHAAAITVLEGVVRPRLMILPYDLVNRQFSLPGILLPRLAMLERSEDDLEAYHRLAQLYRLADREDDALWADARAIALADLLTEEPQPLTQARDATR